MSKTLTIADVFQKDPRHNVLQNQGVAKVSDIAEATLRYELDTFVCDGEYARGLERILATYLTHINKNEQPGVWVSGFFGSGKSHLVKVLQAIWINKMFCDSATARSVVNLPESIQHQLLELSNLGKRHGGLHSISGLIDQSEQPTIRRALMSLVFKSKGLPGSWQQAQFCLWLKREGWYDSVIEHITTAGKTPATELANLFVSSVIPQAILKQSKSYGNTEAEVRTHLKTQFQTKDDPNNAEIVAAIRAVLGDKDGNIPSTLLIIDEVQQTIGEHDAQRSYEFQTIAETLCSSFGGRLLLVATGQSALTGVSNLQRLQGRFPVSVQLSDSDVDAVIRKTILKKRSDRTPEIDAILTRCSGEIDRHLRATKIEPRPEDREMLVADYPVLPTRRRFWECALRAVDKGGIAGQLRNQLRIIHEAVRAMADHPLGEVIPGQVIFEQIATQLVQAGVILPEVDRMIRSQDDGTADGRLRGSLCSLIYLIGKLPREGGHDLGLRATAEILADLLVTDLNAGSSTLRSRIPQLLNDLVNNATLMRIEDEYRLQTQEGSAWEGDYHSRLSQITSNPARLATIRTDLLRNAVEEALKSAQLRQGKSKTPRKLEISYGGAAPAHNGSTIPLWIRDGWEVTEKEVVSESQAAGQESPIIFGFLPKKQANDFQKHLAAYHAAKETGEGRAIPSTQAGQEAKQAMETRMHTALNELNIVVNEIVNSTLIYQGGGNPVQTQTLVDRVVTAGNNALVRLFPEFGRADHLHWSTVFDRARKGDGSALKAVDYEGDPDKHPVTKALLSAVGGGKKGSDLRKEFAAAPYGWDQDAVNAGLVVLVGGGFLNASRDGAVKTANDLDGTSIGPAIFKSEHITISKTQQLKVRKLLGDLNIPFKPGAESAAFLEMLRRFKGLADKAGGEAPLPAKPNQDLLLQLEGKTGNDQYLAIFNAIDQLRAAESAWREAGSRIVQRQPRWNLMNSLLDHAHSLPGIESIVSQHQGIIKNRSLLSDPDPVPDLLKSLTDHLRLTLQKLETTCTQTREKAREVLAADPAFASLPPDEQHSIARDCQLLPIPAIDTSTPESILSALEQRDLEQWQVLTDAISGRATKARQMAISVSTPKARHAHLPKATITNQTELQAWLARAKTDLEEQLAHGPVVI